MLDKFRETAITWDKANRKVYEPLRVSAGDNKGRKLSVQVVNGGVVENITGSSLSLFWETRDKAHSGLDVFTAVDATKGEFEIYYTTGMLSNEGVLNANLVLVDTSGRVVSEPFTITVFKGIDDDAIQSSDSFTALAEALITVNQYDNRIANVENTKVDKSTFEQNKNEVTAQLQQTDAVVAEKAGRTELVDGLTSKVDKDGVEQVTWAMAAQDFREQITGGNTAVVGVDGVSTTNIVNKSVTAPKRTFLGERGEVIGARPAVFDFINNQIRYSSGTSHRIFYRNENYVIPADTTIQFTNADGILLVLFNTESKIISTTNHNTLANIGESHILLGMAYVNSSNLRGADMYGNYEYIADNYRNYDNGYVVSESPIGVDFEKKELKLPQETVYVIGKGRSVNLIANSNISFADVSSFMINIYFDAFTRNFIFYPYNTIVSNTNIYIGTIYPNQKKYFINGQLSEKHKDEMETNLEDMIWSWWVKPLAIRYRGIRDKTYIGFTDNEGYSGVGMIDNESGQRKKIKLKKEKVDDHNAIAVEVMDDGRLMTVYPTGHGSDGIMRIRISKDRESIEEFEEEITVDVGGKSTYSQIFKSGGKYYVFYRNYPADTSDPNYMANGGLFYITSIDGRTWSAPTHVISMPFTVYANIQYVSDNPDLLRVVVTDNGVAWNCNFRLGFFNMATGNMEKEDGTVIGEKALEADMPIIVPKDNGRYQRLLDVPVSEKARTIIAYSTYSPPSTEVVDCDYRVSYWVGGTLRTANLGSAGAPFYVPSRYVGGIAFSYNVNELYLARETGGKWRIEKWTTSDSVTWSYSELVRETKVGYVAIRPIIERGGDKVLWHEGVYNPENYSDFTTDIKFRKIRELA